MIMTCNDTNWSIFDMKNNNDNDNEDYDDNENKN